MSEQTSPCRRLPRTRRQPAGGGPPGPAVRGHAEPHDHRCGGGGQPRRRHFPGHRGGRRARRPAHRVQRPGRAARVEPVLLRARQRASRRRGTPPPPLTRRCSRARSSTRTPWRRPSTAGPSARSSIPLSQTVSDATPLILTGLSVAIAFRAGLFNIGAAGQWIGGAIVATYLGFGVSLPPVVHVIVCLLGGFVGGAVIGWMVGELKARTGAHEVIVTIMLNYIMYNLLSFLLGTTIAPAAARAVEPDQPESSPANARLPHVGGPPPQVDAGFLVGPGRGRGRVVAAVPVHDRVPVPHGGRQPERGAQRGDERRAELGAGDADRRRAGRAGRRRGHPGAAAAPHVQQLRHVRLRRHHRRAARPGEPGRGGAGRAAVRRAARGRHARWRPRLRCRRTSSRCSRG